MKFISHRGNIDTINKNLENTADYINLALLKGYDVEIDVWYLNNKFYLGHDSPDELALESLLIDNRIWCHAKNIDALYELLNLNSPNCFFHNIDSVTLTKSNYIWTYPGVQLTKNSICVLPETIKYITYDFNNCFGVCSDKVSFYKSTLGEQ